MGSSLGFAILVADSTVLSSGFVSVVCQPCVGLSFRSDICSSFVFVVVFFVQ